MFEIALIIVNVIRNYSNKSKNETNMNRNYFEQNFPTSKSMSASCVITSKSTSQPTSEIPVNLQTE